MHCFVRSIDFDALSGRVTWVPVICFGIRAICGRDRGSVEGWGRFVVRLGAVGGNEEGGRGCRAGAGCALDCQGRWVRRRRFGWVGRPLKGKKNTNKHRGGSERSGVLSGVRGQGWWRPPCDAGSLLLRNCSNKAFLKPWLPTHNHLPSCPDEARSSCIPLSCYPSPVSPRVRRAWRHGGGGEAAEVGLGAHLEALQNGALRRRCGSADGDSVSQNFVAHGQKNALPSWQKNGTCCGLFDV